MSQKLAKVISDYKLTIKWPQIKLIVVQCDQKWRDGQMAPGVIY